MAAGTSGAGGGGIIGGGGVRKVSEMEIERDHPRKMLSLPFGANSFSCRIFPPRLLVFSTTKAELIPC